MEQDPGDGLTKIIEEIKATGLTGPEAAARLFQENVAVDDIERALRDLGFFVTRDKDSEILGVSITKFEGEQHPRICDVSPITYTNWINKTE